MIAVPFLFLDNIIYKITDTSNWSVAGLLVVGIFVAMLVSGRGGQNSNNTGRSPRAPEKVETPKEPPAQ